MLKQRRGPTAAARRGRCFAVACDDKDRADSTVCGVDGAPSLQVSREKDFFVIGRAAHGPVAFRFCMSPLEAANEAHRFRPGQSSVPLCRCYKSDGDAKRQRRRKQHADQETKAV